MNFEHFILYKRVPNVSWVEMVNERMKTHSKSHGDQTEQDQNLHSEISMSEREVTWKGKSKVQRINYEIPKDCSMLKNIFTSHNFFGFLTIFFIENWMTNFLGCLIHYFHAPLFEKDPKNEN